MSDVPTNRIDRLGRDIRTSFAIEADVQHEERIRMLAAKALRKELDEAVEFSVVFLKELKQGEEIDYIISPESIRNMLAATPKAIANEKPPKQPSFRKINKDRQEALEDIQDRISELAAELEHQKLPERDGPLVIFTGISSKKKMEKANVWKGVADFADVEN